LNAPSYFGKTWNFLKKWIDPRTAEKLVVLRHGEVLPTLTSSMELANIPIQFGGQFSFQHGAVPKLDSGICRTLQWMTQPVPALPTGPIKWIADQQGRRTAVAVGRVDGEPRHQVIASLNN
jgi:hypothetical protein